MNIFMILCDELRADTLGYMGNDIIKTPHLDQLASESVVFDQAYCNSPMCVPSRVSFATGRYAHSHGALDNMLSPVVDEVSLYKRLQDKGYYTFNHGKWHCNIDPKLFGMDLSKGAGTDMKGDELDVTCFGIRDRELRKRTTYKRNEGEIPLIISGTRPSHKDDTLDSIITDHFIANLDDMPKDQAIFGRLSIMDPHTPYIPSEPYASMYDPASLPLPDSWNEVLDDKPVLHSYFRKTRGFEALVEDDFRKSKASYYGLVTHVDDRVGKTIKALKSRNLYDDSLILFIADHGSMMGEHGFVEKWGHMYDSVMQIPIMVKFPKGEYAGKQLSSFVESVDLMPTVLDYIGMEIPTSVQGKSLLPYIKGETDNHKDCVFGQYYCGSLQNEAAKMVRDNEYKLTTYPEGNRLEGFLPNDHHLKMSPLFDQDYPLGELYDIKNDPEEMNNLFDNPEFAEVKQTYLVKIATWMKNQGNVVDENTMTWPSAVSMHVVKQGENMNDTKEAISGTKRWGTLSRKFN